MYKEEYLILKKFVQLAKNDGFIPISIEMERQKTGNFFVSELEASLKIALFNSCKDK
ncbi:hypothetical protein AALA44_10220 [Enterococcus ratti]|uniref:hypothetical protein n=1 Tax=Enterococcus ratti TaxID=150033 RepID=UPI003510F190